MNYDIIHSITFIVVGLIVIIAGLGYWNHIRKISKWSKETGKRWELHPDAMLISMMFVMILPPLLPILGLIIIIFELSKIL